MGPGIDHLVLGEIAKVGQDHFGKVSLPHANLGSAIRRISTEKPYPKIESRRCSSNQPRNIRRGERDGHFQFVGVPNEIKLYASGKRENKIRGERAQVKR